MFLLAAALLGALAVEPPPAPAADFDLPVSLERIRAALEEAPIAPLRVESAPPATFTVHVEARHFDERAIVPSLDFRSGPGPGSPRRIAAPTAEQPLVAIDTMPLIRAIAGALSHARRSAAERAADEEVERGLAAFCVDHACR